METCAKSVLERVRWKGLEYPADVSQVTTNVTTAVWEHSGKAFCQSQECRAIARTVK